MSEFFDSGSRAMAASRCQKGFSLVELMVALALGLLVTLGIFTVTQGNRQNLRITEGLSETQETIRLAFELIARDFRAAGNSGCGPLPVAQVETGSYSGVGHWVGTWWPVRGFAGSTGTSAVTTGTDVGERVLGTEALQLQGAGQAVLLNVSSIQSSVGRGAKNQLPLMEAPGTLATSNGLVIVCDMQQASLHQVSSATSTAMTFVTGQNAAGVDIGFVNISNEDDPQFMVSRYFATTWYIGNNGRNDEGGRSLYRRRLTENGSLVTEEILPGVVDMVITYHGTTSNDFVGVGSVTNTAAGWSTVNAMEVTLTTETTAKNLATNAAGGSSLVGSDGRLKRSHTQVIALRNTDA